MARRMMALAGLALAVGLAAPVSAQDVDRVVATVNGTEITLGHMIALRARLPAQFDQMPDEALFEGILDQLVEQAATAQAVGEDFDRRTRLQLDNARNEIITNNHLTRLAEDAVTDEAVQQAYNNQFVEGPPVTEYNAAHILVPTEVEARALRDQLEEGADFAELAQEHSQDPGSGSRGGDLGWFGQGMMVAPFEEAVVALEPGELSEPVESQFGWHLILLNETRTREAPPLDAVRGDLVRELQQETVINAIAQAREAAEIELFAEGIDPALLRDQTLLDQ